MWAKVGSNNFWQPSPRLKPTTGMSCWLSSRSSPRISGLLPKLKSSFKANEPARAHMLWLAANVSKVACWLPVILLVFFITKSEQTTTIDANNTTTPSESARTITASDVVISDEIGTTYLFRGEDQGGNGPDGACAGTQLRHDSNNQSANQSNSSLDPANRSLNNYNPSKFIMTAINPGRPHPGYRILATSSRDQLADELIQSNLDVGEDDESLDGSPDLAVWPPISRRLAAKYRQQLARSLDDHQDQLIAPEDDDLFLIGGRKSALDEPQTVSRRAPGRRSVRSSRDKTPEGLQTIYFGGFFPWLTDEDAQVAAGGQQQNAARQKQQLPLMGNQREQRTKQHPYDQNSTLTSANLSAYSSENRHQLGRFILPAVRLALDHINHNSSLLSSYRLEIVPRDTQCNATISLKEFFDMVYEEPKKMLLYGDACRVSTDPIAKASYFFDLIQISYADTDPIYTIENYPNFFRVVPSENALSLARIPFIRHFNWTRVGTIYQNLPRYSLPHSKLLTDLERFNIVIKQSVSLPGSVDGLQNRDLGDELRKLKEKDVRIILGNFDEEWALLLFCEAFREKMTGRKYQWILTGVGEDKLWQYYKSRGSSCSELELLAAMDGYIITDITAVTRSQHPTISGMMAHQYSNEYKKRARDMHISIEENKFYGYVYDGIWAIALALHRVDYQLKYYNRLVEAGKAQLNPELEGLNSLIDFDYHKPIWVKLIRNALNKTRFNGVTGTVSFHKNERPGLISFSQFQAFRDMNEVVIGSYDALNEHLDLKVGFPIFWRGPSPPIDYTIQRVTPFRINRTIFVIISIMALFGIVLAFVFLTINIKFRNQRYIKMSSPYLNNLIIIGCILTYTSVIILGLDSGLTSEYNFPYICNARAWVLMAGFTLAFGSMFSKTFRVHSIFTNIKLHKRVIKDYKLFMVVFILLTLDVCILIVWQYFDPFYRETNNGTSIQDSDNEDVIIVPEMEHCQSKRMTIFLSVIYVYKGLLMAFGCFLAWETRHVSIPALNDSKYIGLSVYNVVIMCVIGASLSFVLRDQQDASFVIISIFIIFCSTTTLCLVFVPKLIELKQNPRASDHRVRATLKTFKKNYHEEAMGATPASYRDIHGKLIGDRGGYGVSLNEKIKIMLGENIKQRSVLKEKTYELEALTYKYKKIQSMIQSGQYLQAVNTTATNLPDKAGLAVDSNKIMNPGNVTSSSRSPSREIVSFSTLKDDKSNLKSPTSELSARPACLTSANKSELGRSPLMSTSTQITTTNTTSTSCTNNNTDLTCDYSSRLVSQSTTCGSSSATDGKSVSHKLDNSKRDKRVYIAQAPDNHRCPLAVNFARDFNLELEPNGHRSARKYLPSRCNYESSYCPMSKLNDNELTISSDDHRKKMPSSKSERSIKGMLSPASSQSGLFSVFSYISSAAKEDPMATHEQSQMKGQYLIGQQAENNLCRWLEGPFCTLIMRHNDNSQATRLLQGRQVMSVPGEAVSISRSAANERSQLQCQQRQLGLDGEQAHRKQDETRASCPDIVVTSRLVDATASGSTQHKQALRKQIGHQESRRPRMTSAKANGAVGDQRSRLPRTISMIEYLGLNEIDLIARRHDKLVRRHLERGRHADQSCCLQAKLTTMTDCAYCRQSSSSVVDVRAARVHYQSSDNNLAFSSGNLLGSADLMQTSSRFSCSTCCSLVSTDSYSSHSDLFGHYDDQLSRSISSSQTVSTNTDSQSSSNSNQQADHQRRYALSDEQSLASGSTVTKSSQSSFIGNHHNHHHHHHHHHHQPQQQQTGHLCQYHQQIVQNKQATEEMDERGQKPVEGAASSGSSAGSSFTKRLVLDRSLCTSGALYHAPEPREAANGSAHLGTNTDQSTSGKFTIDPNTSTLAEVESEQDDDPRIKCDILENL